MGELVRRFATRVILLHVLAFAAVLGLVGGAAAQVYFDARRQSLEQAVSRQELVASQTGHAVADFFDGILENLDLLRRSEGSGEIKPRERLGRLAALRGLGGLGGPAGGAIKEPTGPPGEARSFREAQAADPRDGGVREGRAGGNGGPGGPTTRRVFPLPSGLARPGVALAPVLYQQLQSRVTHLFAYDPEQGVAREFGRREDGLSTERVLAELGEEIRSVERAMISRAHTIDGREFVAVCAPVQTVEHHRQILVAVVAWTEVRGRFLDELTDVRGLSYALRDAGGRKIGASDEKLAALTVQSLAAVPGVESIGKGPADMGLRFDALNKAGEKVAAYLLPGGVGTGETKLVPSLVVTVNIDVEGPDWTLVVASPLSEVDALVSQLFRRTMFWSAFLVGATGLLLASTATQFIRSRMRLEREQQAALRRDLEHARRIQLEWLPEKPPAMPSVDLHAVNVPASHVSGDLYNWLTLPAARAGGPDRLALIMGDVTGHGMSAAMMMSSVQLLTLSALRFTDDPGTVLTQVNDTLCLHDFKGQFVTLQVAVLDVETGELRVSGAGHPYPVVVPGHGSVADRAVRTLDLRPELMLGVSPDVRYETLTFRLSAGDTLLLYTDGLTEAMGTGNEMFGGARLLKASALGAADGRADGGAPDGGTSRAVCEALLRAVAEFVGGKSAADDLTLLAVRWAGATVDAGTAPRVLQAV